MKLKLFNTLTHKKEEFEPLKDKLVNVYTCGPTVYSYAHIGNLRSYVFEDILKRILLFNKFKVKHVMNITDVGHLTSDADTGEDKIEAGARKEGKSAWEIAEFYTKAFKNDIKKLNILPPNIWCKATDHIKEQLDLIKKLEEKGYTYVIPNDGIYFDSSKFKNYGKLAKIKIEKLKPGARVEFKGKKYPTDFALWKFSPQLPRRQMEWESKYGTGFPGWHLECSAMAMKYLGPTIDIHCGGTDHIPVHHTNEIAQSEAATGKQFVKFWLHGEFLILEKEKMAKSEGNVIILKTLQDKGYDILAFRYLCLTAHYRTPLTFTFDALDSAQNSLNRLREIISGLKKETKNKKSKLNRRYYSKFLEAINDDLDIPKALSILWSVLRDKTLRSEEKIELIKEFDEVFALNLLKFKEEKIPQEILKLANKRELARKEKNFELADKLREEIKQKGYLIEDSDSSFRIKKV